MSEIGWRREFEDPIPLPAGGELRTLLDAGNYIASLPEEEAALQEWQTAIEVLMLCSRGGPTMAARMGVMMALNRHVERVFNPDAKKASLGKAKAQAG
jgi:hypothetical protein